MSESNLQYMLQRLRFTSNYAVAVVVAVAVALRCGSLGTQQVLLGFSPFLINKVWLGSFIL